MAYAYEPRTEPLVLERAIPDGLVEVDGELVPLDAWIALNQVPGAGSF
jgi:hypothetical protein